MRRELFGVVEAARGLQVAQAPTATSPRGIRLGCPREEFPDRLWRLARAIESLDQAGADSAESEPPAPDEDPAMDAARLRVALEGVFRWMKSAGVDVSEPHALVAEALGVVAKPEKQRSYKPIPRFAPNGYRKPVKQGPLLRLDPVPGEAVSLRSLAEREFRANAVEASLGSAAPTSKVAVDRARG